LHRRDQGPRQARDHGRGFAGVGAVRRDGVPGRGDKSLAPHRGPGMGDARPAWIHPTALVEEGVTLGTNTRAWDGVHIRKNARIGHDCIVGEKTYVAYGVPIGNYVKINAVVYICAEVEIEDFVMIRSEE